MAWTDYRFDADQLSLRRNETKQATLPVATAAIITDAMTLIDLASPTRFLTLTARLLPWLAALTAKAAAPIGAAFTFLALVTGSLWGRPMWGTYWEWDARLTSVLILFLMYLGVIALWRAVEDPSRAARAAAILTLDRAFLIPLLVMAVAFSLLFVTLHLAAMRNEVLRRRVRALQMMLASRRSA